MVIWYARLSIIYMRHESRTCCSSAQSVCMSVHPSFHYWPNWSGWKIRGLMKLILLKLAGSVGMRLSFGPKTAANQQKNAIFGALLSDGRPPWLIWLECWRVVGGYCSYVWCKFYWDQFRYGWVTTDCKLSGIRKNCDFSAEKRPKKPGGCQWAQKVKPSRLASFQAKNGTFRLVWQKSLLKLGWRVMLGLHFCSYKKFCSSNQEKVTGPASWDSSRFAISWNFQLGSIWGAGPVTKNLD